MSEKTKKDFNAEILDIGNTKREYTFINTVDTLITVAFTKWKKDTIKEAKFMVYRSKDLRLLYRATKCDESDNGNENKLVLHTLYVNQNQPIEPISKKLKIKNLTVPATDSINFYHIEYEIGEVYKAPGRCDEKPDTHRGGAVMKP
ncbi:MAG: hypothetical protein ABJL44_14020 [Algibacter sp.]